MRSSVILLAIAFGLDIRAPALTGSGDSGVEKQRITFATRGDTIMSALIRMASSNRLPLGLVLGLPASRTFFDEAKDVRFEDAAVEQVLSAFIDRSKYTWNAE